MSLLFSHYASIWNSFFPITVSYETPFFALWHYKKLMFSFNMASYETLAFSIWQHMEFIFFPLQRPMKLFFLIMALYGARVFFHYGILCNPLFSQNGIIWSSCFFTIEVSYKVSTF